MWRPQHLMASSKEQDIISDRYRQAPVTLANGARYRTDAFNGKAVAGPGSIQKVCICRPRFRRCFRISSTRTAAPSFVRTLPFFTPLPSQSLEQGRLWLSRYCAARCFAWGKPDILHHVTQAPSDAVVFDIAWLEAFQRSFRSIIQASGYCQAIE
ncbi:MAG: hypothetical protein M1816_005447 [Peltula sp. TS41687]|nr:MAG: hypothetical protein M1816_005447 [Peltula sp. TS41687]